MLLLSFFITGIALICFLFAVATASNLQLIQSLDDSPVLHFKLRRRGGSFLSNEKEHQIANLTYLAAELERVEARFNLTRREVKGNTLIRKAKEKTIGLRDERDLMGKVAEKGHWYTTIGLGDPPQTIEMDLDMLVSDFYVLTTSSKEGSRYDDFFSQENVKSNIHPFPHCALPTDVFTLPTINLSVPLSFAHCRPSKSSTDTLGPSGSLLGLAPSEHLSQLKTSPIFKQILNQGIIGRPIFSLMLINGQEGVLSVGGTSASAVGVVEEQTKRKLDMLGTQEKIELSERPEDVSQDAEMLTKRARRESTAVSSRQSSWEDAWKWSKVQGAEGWWQILMQGVWVDGIKILKNQPVVIDISTPLILAPPSSVSSFYASISGSRPLPPPHSSFYIFPCLNPPVLHFEFDRWTFPAMQGGRGTGGLGISGIPGGRFSLGRWREGSGYCVGAVVETRMGIRREEQQQGWRGMGKRAGGRGGAGKMGMIGKGELAGNGLRGVWVVGEGFLRGVGSVFDWANQRVGFRTF